MPNGGAFVFHRDSLTGGLKSLMTPRGHVHGLASRNMLGYKSVSYLPPWSRVARYELQFDFAGRLTARIRPPFDKVVYLYEGQRLKAVYGGAGKEIFQLTFRKKKPQTSSAPNKFNNPETYKVTLSNLAELVKHVLIWWSSMSEQ